jgi:cell division protein FtsL
MTSFAKSDIFFFVTTIIELVLAVLLVWFLYYAIGIARDLKKLSRRIEREGQRIADDVEDFREEIKSRAQDLPVIGSFFRTRKHPRRKAGDDME